MITLYESREFQLARFPMKPEVFPFSFRLNGFSGRRIIAADVDASSDSDVLYKMKGADRPDLPISFTVYFNPVDRTWLKKAHNQRSEELLRIGFECLHKSLESLGIVAEFYDRMTLKYLVNFQGQHELTMITPHFGHTLQGMMDDSTNKVNDLYKASFRAATQLYKHSTNSIGKHLFPADPNPGNIIHLSDGRFLFIDFEVKNVWRSYSVGEVELLWRNYLRSANRWKLDIGDMPIDL